jgi:hypothetical protein
MELTVLGLVQKSHFIEVMTLVVTLRIIWAQTLALELSDSRSLPFLLFFFRQRSFKRKVLASQVDMLTGSQTRDLRSLIREEEQLRSAIFRYNQLESSRNYHWVLLSLLAVALALHYSPLVLVSFVSADLVVARIHQHIAASM